MTLDLIRCRQPIVDAWASSRIEHEVNMYRVLGKALQRADALFAYKSKLSYQARRVLCQSKASRLR